MSVYTEKKTQGLRIRLLGKRRAETSVCIDYSNQETIVVRCYARVY